MKIIIYITAVLLIITQGVEAQVVTAGQYLPSGVSLVPPGFDRDDPFTTGNWKLVFSDEFNVDGYLDPNKWVTYEPGPTWGGPPTALESRDAGFSIYKDENVRVSQGSCILTVKHEPCSWTGTKDGQTVTKNADYSSAVLASKVDKQMFERGMLEARIAMGKGKFTHQTFWTWPYNEIDITEFSPYKGEKTTEMNLHNNYYKAIDPSHAELGDCGARDGVGQRLDETFHTYTCVWDKNYIYIYIDHQIKKIYSRLLFNYTNNYAGRFEDFNYPDVTTGGYYWLKECFMKTNNPVYIMLTNAIDPRSEAGSWADRHSDQAAGLSSEMWIDWVRIYQRYECDENPVIENSILFPYESLSSQYRNFTPPAWTTHNTITAGTQSSQPWVNIVPNWDIGHYTARQVTLLPNFESYPVYHSPDPSNPNQGSFYTGFDFLAKDCPAMDAFSGYIQPEHLSGVNPTDPIDTLPEIFNCADLDTAALNSVFASGNTDSINYMFYVLDSLGCQNMINYLHDQFANNGQTFRRSSNLAFEPSANVYPNPASDNATILVMLPTTSKVSVQITDILGHIIYSLPDQTFEAGSPTINLNTSNLSSGMYNLRIRINDKWIILKLSVLN